MNEKNKNEIKIGKIKNLFFDKEIVSGLSDCIGLSRIISMFYDSGNISWARDRNTERHIEREGRGRWIERDREGVRQDFPLNPASIFSAG